MGSEDQSLQVESNKNQIMDEEKGKEAMEKEKCKIKNKLL